MPISNRSSESATPSAALKRLGDALVGTWDISGEIEGQTKYEWMEGGFFLIQHVDLVYRRKIKGIEVIGHLHRISEAPSNDIWTRFYDFLAGLTLDYVYELGEDTLTIWFERKGSDNRFTGKFSQDHNSLAGAWKWPGGGYECNWTRIE